MRKRPGDMVAEVCKKDEEKTKGLQIIKEHISKSRFPNKISKIKAT